MPTAKKEPFYIVRTIRDGVREVKVYTTKGRAMATAKAIQNTPNGTASDPIRLSFPEARADRARCLQAIMNGEDLAQYQEALTEGGRDD